MHKYSCILIDMADESEASKIVLSAFGDMLSNLLHENQRMAAIITKLPPPRGERELAETDKVVTQCFGHMITSLEDCVYWMRRLNNNLENQL